MLRRGRRRPVGPGLRFVVALPVAPAIGAGGRVRAGGGTGVLPGPARGGGRPEEVTFSGRVVAGSSPDWRRLRTSLAVAGEIPARRATSRRDACGFSAISSAARQRPSTLLSGRARPSRPIRTFNCGTASVERRRMVATALAPMPDARAMARSDICGWDSMMRVAATLRSVCESGRPWVMLAWTALKKASSAVPSKNSTSIVPWPLIRAASRRCMPSITRMSDRRTRMGGSGPSTSESRATCSWSGPSERGDSPGSRLAIETGTITGSRPVRGAGAPVRDTGTPVGVPIGCGTDADSSGPGGCGSG